MVRAAAFEYAYNNLPTQTQAALHKIDCALESSLDLNLEQSGSTPSCLSHESRVPIQLAQTQVKAVEESKAQPLVTSQRLHKAKVEGGFIEQLTDAWLEILKVYETWCKQQKYSSAIIRDIKFANAYNNRQLQLYDWVHKYVPQVSRSTLKAKNKCRQTANSLQALGGNYGNRKGKGKIASNRELQQAIETCVAAGGKHWGSTQVYEILLLEFGYEPQDFSLGQLRSWMRLFRQQNLQKWLMYMEPDRIKGTATPAFGSRSCGVVRPNQIWEISLFCQFPKSRNSK